jgi:hypothetical protein
MRGVAELAATTFAPRPINVRNVAQSWRAPLDDELLPLLPVRREKAAMRVFLF